MTDETSLKSANVDEARMALLELERLANDGRPDLVINKVPKKTLKDFKDLARKEFDGDYGITMKVVMEQFLTNAKEYDMITRIMNLESMLSSLLSSRDQQIDKNGEEIKASSRSFIKTLDQTIISDSGG